MSNDRIKEQVFVPGARLLSAIPEHLRDKLKALPMPKVVVVKPPPDPMLKQKVLARRARERGR